jgi:hypothetical protein
VTATVPVDFGRAGWPLSDRNKDFVLVAIRNLHVRGPGCQTVVEAHLSRFTFGDISVKARLGRCRRHRHGLDPAQKPSKANVLLSA